jgi:hypothetical protein
LSWNAILDQICDSIWQELSPISLVRNPTAVGRNLPDADGPGYVSLNGGFREANRSLIGQKQSFITYKSTP